MNARCRCCCLCYHNRNLFQPILRTGHYIGIPTSRVYVFQLWRVFELFSRLRQSRLTKSIVSLTQLTLAFRPGDQPGLVLHDKQSWLATINRRAKKIYYQINLQILSLSRSFRKNFKLHYIDMNHVYIYSRWNVDWWPDDRCASSVPERIFKTIYSSPYAAHETATSSHIVNY